ncbi:MAG: hypothetical protein IH586_12775 [Anaerolineaceae bacterium]|nr:hypothetical protein [Anaerolineaceae bacterium]
MVRGENDQVIRFFHHLLEGGQRFNLEFGAPGSRIHTAGRSRLGPGVGNLHVAVGRLAVIPDPGRKIVGVPFIQEEIDKAYFFHVSLLW